MNFSDDVAIWIASAHHQVIEARLQKRLNEIQHWMSKWRTILSVEKTVFTIFNKAAIFHKDTIKLTYNSAEIKAVRNFKFLGITLDPALRLHQHARAIKERATKRINMLRRIRGKGWGASPKLLITSYKVLIRPIIEYVPFATLAMSESSQTILNRIQNSAIRTATYWPGGASSTQMNALVGLETINTRAARLSVNYINKAVINNDSIDKRVADYNVAKELEEGSHAKGIARPTIIGLIRQHM